MTQDIATADEMIGDPAAHFETPEEVIGRDDLSVHLKQKILESWKAEASHMAESAAERMDGGEPSRLQEISRALLRLKNSTLVPHNNS